MTREEIYRQAILNTAVTDDLLESGQNAVYAAMDVWGKQEAIGFRKWNIERNRFLFDEAGQWPSPNETDDQLYNLYLESKNKKQ